MDSAYVRQVLLRTQNGSDIRGSVIATEKEEKTLSGDMAAFIAAGFQDFLAQKTGQKPEELRICIGHDSRITAEEIKQNVIAGMRDAKIYDCGMVSTPSMFQATVLPECGFDGAVMITASHLPFNRNGLKMMTQEGALEHGEVTRVLEIAADYAVRFGKEDSGELISASVFRAPGKKAEPFDLISVYASHMCELIRREINAKEYDRPLQGLHIVVDAGNGAAGFFAKQILEPLGADTKGSVFLDPDGMFPNHIPNPENAKAIEAICTATVQAGADLGVIFDCHGDRGAVVFSDGTEVNRNTLIALLSAILSKDHPGTTVVTDSVTSDELAEFLDKIGMKHFRYRRGYKNVIDKGIELNRAGEPCELAIETSGHGAFRENHFSDDGAYIAVKIIITMAQLRKEGKRIEDLIADLRQPAEAAEERYRILEKDFRTYGQKLLDAFRGYVCAQEHCSIVEPNYEGVRVAYDDGVNRGWYLMRMSLHDPVIPVNIESSNPGGAGVIHDRMQPFFEGKKLEKQ